MSSFLGEVIHFRYWTDDVTNGELVYLYVCDYDGKCIVYPDDHDKKRIALVVDTKKCEVAIATKGRYGVLTLRVLEASGILTDVRSPMLAVRNINNFSDEALWLVKKEH